MKLLIRRILTWLFAAVVLVLVGQLLVAVSGNASANAAAETGAESALTDSTRSAARERIQKRLLAEKKKYETMLRENPDDEVALRKLVRALLDLGEYKEAVKLVERVPLSLPKDSAGPADFSPLPDIDLKPSPELKQELLDQRTAIMKDPTDETATRKLVLALFRAGRYREAVALLERPAVAAADEAPVRTAAVPPAPVAPPVAPPAPTPAPAPAPAVATVEDRPPAAPVTVTKLPDKAPSDPREAKAYYKAKLRNEPGNESALRGLVSALFALGEDARALDVLEKGIDVAPPATASSTVRPDVRAKPLPDVEKGVDAAVAARDEADAAWQQTEARLRRRIASLEARSMEATRQLEAVNRALQEETSKYEALFARGDATEDALLERIKAREAEARAASERVRGLGDRIAQERGTIAETAGRSAAKRKALSARIGELEQEASTAVSDLQAAREALAAQQEKHAWLEGAIEERRAELEQQVAQIEEAIASEKEIAAVRERFKKEQARRAEMDKKHAAAEKKLKEQIASLEEALQQTRADLATARTGLDTQRKDYAELVRKQSKAEETMLDQIAAMEKDSLKATATLLALHETLRTRKKEDEALVAEPMGTDVDVRGIDINLDLIYSANAEQTAINLARAVARVVELGANTVYLRAFSDLDGNGSAEAVYFPTTPLRVRADLLGTATEQFHENGIAVVAAMPTLSVTITDQFKARKLAVMEYTGAGIRPALIRQPRLSPFSRDALQLMAEIYADLAASAAIDGVLFLEDGYLTDTEDFNPAARADYAGIAGPGDISPDSLSSSQREAWARVKSEKIEYFIGGLKGAVKRRRTGIPFARALFAPALHRPESEMWLAQNYGNALQRYDRVIVVADPAMESIAAPLLWLRSLVRDASAFEDGIGKTVFKVPSREMDADRWVPERTLMGRVQSLLNEGARHAVYGPDDFEVDRPRMARIKTGMFSD